MNDILALAGEWTEQQQHESFSSDFFKDDVYILFANDQRIGCFSICEGANSIFLQKAYIEPDWVHMHIMTHQDTLQYMPQPDIFIAPEN